MRVRTLTPADIPAVRALHLELFPVRYGAAFYQELPDATRYVALVLVDDAAGGRVVGVATGFFSTRSLGWTPWDSSTARIVYLATFGVHESVRRRGLGTLLLQRFRDEVQRVRPVDALVLHVKTLNTAAVAFYEAHAFAHYRLRSNHYRINGQRYDALKMVLPLSDRGREMLRSRQRTCAGRWWRWLVRCRWLEAWDEPDEDMDDDKAQ